MAFSNEINDFVKGFAAGAEIVDSAEESKLKKQKYAVDMAEAQARTRHYDAMAAKDAPFDTTPFADEWRKNHGNAPDGGSGSVTPFDPKKAPAFLNSINDRYSLPPGFMLNTGWLESRFGANAQNPNSSAGGMFQFTNATAKQYGLTNKNDPMASADAAARLAVDNRNTLRKALGREPTGAELYLAHQQGAKGAASLLSNPNMPAAGLVGLDAVKNNGGRPDMSAADFANMWINKYRKLEKRADPRVTAEAETPVQYGARGGMIRKYEDGGAVRSALPIDEGNAPNDAENQKPYYADDLMADVGNAFDKLGEVVKGGLQGLQDRFGLNQQPAVSQADPDYQGRVMSFLKNEAAPPPEQIAELKRKVDPNSQLDDALATTYGMVKGYEYLLSKGNYKGAQQLAASVISHLRAKSMSLGALAVQAIQSGEDTAARKALIGAFNSVPNGQRATIQGNKAVIMDDKTGETVKEFELTPEMMMNAAMGFTQGDAYINEMMSVASGVAGRLPKEDGPSPAMQKYMTEMEGGGAPPQAIPADGKPVSPASAQGEQPAPTTSAPQAQPDASASPAPTTEAVPVATPFPQDEIDQAVRALGPKPQLPPNILEMDPKTEQPKVRAFIANKQADWEKRRSELMSMSSANARAGFQESQANQREAKKYRNEEAGKVDEAYDNLMMERPEGAPPVPKKQENAIKETARSLLRLQDVSREQGIRVAQQIFDQGVQIELVPRKGGGGSVKLANGRSYKLDDETFDRVKTTRDGFAKSKEKNAVEDKRPSAMNEFRQGAKGVLRSIAEETMSAIRGRPVSSLNPNEDGRSGLDLDNVTTSAGYQQRFGTR